MKKLTILLFVTTLSLFTFATDWSSIAWLADGAGGGAYAEKYKVDKDFGQTVINIQIFGEALEPGIYTTFGGVVEECSLPEGKYLKGGSGILLYLSAFTQKETEVSVVADNLTYNFKVFYVDGEGEISNDPEPVIPGGEGEEGDLTPATFYGQSRATIAGNEVIFNWSITRNADGTLTFDLTWNADVEGLVARISISNGDITSMRQEGREAIYTTDETFVDGEPLSGSYFYLPYAGGGVESIDIVGYVVGAENEEPTQGGEGEGGEGEGGEGGETPPVVDPGENPGENPGEGGNDNPDDGIEEVLNQKSEITNHKLMIDGHLYILRNGHIFDAKGARVK